MRNHGLCAVSRKFSDHTPSIIKYWVHQSSEKRVWQQPWDSAWDQSGTKTKDLHWIHSPGVDSASGFLWGAKIQHSDKHAMLAHITKHFN